MGGNTFGWQQEVDTKGGKVNKNFNFLNYQNLPEQKTEALDMDGYAMGKDGKGAKIKDSILSQLGEGENIKNWDINLSNAKVIGEGQLPVSTQTKSFKDMLGRMTGKKEYNKVVLDESAVVGGKFKYNNEDFYHDLVDAKKRDINVDQNKQITLFIPKSKISIKPSKYNNSKKGTNTPVTSGLTF